MADNGPEPTPWELMRGLTRVEEAIHQLGGKVVSLELYTADQLRVSSRLRDLETGSRDSKAAVIAADNRAEDQRTRNRWTLIGLVGGPFISAFTVFLIQGGFRV
ncbi:hypothetical protein E3T26_14495 [Cryobacterium sp. TMT1-21]|uniref:hypothetical protein n=1 Tax=unclassified Cryobacterium TaxID=2649013 RepID=UPI001068FD4E|nr:MULTISPECIES: hypothetical protein [unclassified Cryobacterium]TFD09833.1 hypothetical protein E3T26_14495 [Cryobacterium sp. TMT1-21]TFD41763.1 hypothetical protein E3T37_03670 [Cryobacterium sp. TMT2-10]